jgi:hypothetical protein
MNEPDPLDSLLREWKAPEPGAGLDQDVMAAYRSTVCPPRPSAPRWQRFWRMRVSVPVPALLAAAVVVFGLLIWLRPPAPSPASPGGSDALTRLNASGFQPLPNGEARVIPAMEVQK